LTISNVVMLEAALFGSEGPTEAPSPELVARAQQRRPALLRQALRSGRRDAVDLLLAHGWQPDLHDCAALGDVSGLQAHLADGDPESRDEHGAHALHLAVAHGHLPATRLLLAAGASPRASYAGALEPLHLAAADGDLDLVACLLSAGADVDARDEAGFTPLHLAAAAGHPDAVRRLLLAGADPDARIGTGDVASLARQSGCQRTLGLVRQLARPRCCFS